ncbi:MULTISPECIES: HAD family hydrolase [unclassified Dyella]|uniref:HAD family hydrolase n=1 Tax=unclassified Dyella TaxID=2634549 RepID=UPI000C838309|nr:MULTISPECIES: HAD family hydrolase [unclassified Dyella]MDR3445067.1 HAD family hydrolase [Dyella sp.]
MLLALVWANACMAAQDPLPSWNDGGTKQQIESFVTKVTKPGSPDFVEPAKRIAVFDNDGTLWTEQPIYFEFFFVLDQVKAQAPQHPEWKTTEPFKSALAGDMKGLAASGEKGAIELMAATHAGMSTDEFARRVNQWVSTARHPKTHRVFTEMVYQPMLELLHYLRENGFKTYIVSGGGQDFMRAWAEAVYGVPPEQVIGSETELKYELRDGQPVLIKEPNVALVDDHAGKPVGIERFIGRKPIFAFGNSDGDQQMLEWTTSGGGARFAGLVHHTDAAREYAYDRKSPVGTLDKALDEATAKGWTVVDMKQDWKVIYPAEKQ